MWIQQTEYSKDFRSHIDNLDEIIMRLREANLKLHPDKCKFLFRQVKYLGYKISEKGTEASDEKTEVVRKFDSPKNTKQIKQFLGLTGYFRDFIKGYADLVTPMTDPLRKNISFVWSLHTSPCGEAPSSSHEALRRDIIALP